MKQQLMTMLAMQDAMNTRVHPDWRAQNFEWYRAIWVECAELMDHYGWKWWKQQTPDMEQVVLELIDIWHFGLSAMLSSGRSPEQLAEHIAQHLDLSVRDCDFRIDLETFAEATLVSYGFDVQAFAKLMVGAGLDFEQLYRSYVGKNVLNFFRQDHGYKDGSYKKLWGGKEDNEHLVEVLRSLDADHPDFSEVLYSALADRYAQQA